MSKLTIAKSDIIAWYYVELQPDGPTLASLGITLALAV